MNRPRVEIALLSVFFFKYICLRGNVCNNNSNNSEKKNQQQQREESNAKMQNIEHSYEKTNNNEQQLKKVRCLLFFSTLSSRGFSSKYRSLCKLLAQTTSLSGLDTPSTLFCLPFFLFIMLHKYTHLHTRSLKRPCGLPYW